MAASMGHEKPLGKLVFEKSNFLLEKSRHKQHITDHYFNYCVDVMVPDCDRLATDVLLPLKTEQFYLVRQVPLSALIKPDFIEAFVKRGQLYMVSHGNHIDTGDCVALLPTGTLLMHLGKDTYEQLGLEGKPSVFKEKKTLKYVVQISLTDPSFVVGRKKYERVRWCLEDRLDLSFTFLVIWIPHDTKISSTSIQNYFQTVGCTCNRIAVKKKTREYTDLTVPVISPEQFGDQSGENCPYMEFFEWLGACAVEADLSGCEADDYVNTYSCPVPNRIVGNATAYQFRGMFSPSSILSVLEALRSFVNKKSVPWASLTVHGFADSPVSWADREHRFFNNGDNLYTFLVFPNHDYWLYSAIGAKDIC